jgi:hypothetical protein
MTEEKDLSFRYYIFNSCHYAALVKAHNAEEAWLLMKQSKCVFYKYYAKYLSAIVVHWELFGYLNTEDKEAFRKKKKKANNTGNYLFLYL